MDIEGILAITFFFGSIFGMFYIFFFTRHRERMNMIERGMDPNANSAPPDPNKAMRNGLLWAGVGIGLLMGWVFNEYVMHADDDSVLPYFIGAAIFGGLAQVLYYLKFSRKQQG